MQARWTRRATFVALTLIAIGIPPAADAEPASNPVVAAAQALVASLDAKQRRRMVLPFDDRARRDWHFTPRNRKGLALKDMNAAQRKAAHALLESALSKEGYAKVQNVFKIEGILRQSLSAARRRTNPNWRHPLLYHIAIYGVPATAGVWAWRIEGHHLSIHMTYKDGHMVASTPLFIGTTIDRVSRGEHKGLRVLRREIGGARALLRSLTINQRVQATTAREAPSFALGPGGSPKTFLKGGLVLAELNPEQQKLFWALVETYVNTIATARAQATLAGMRRTSGRHTRLVWLGSTNMDRRYAFRIGSPSFAIEFFNDNGHIHSVWRDAANDFGDRALRKK